MGEGSLLLFRTVQTSAFRNLFECLKDVLCDANLIFDHTGCKLLQMDNNHNVLVSVRLNATSFEEYYCPGRVVAGINVGNMFRLVKSIGQSDTLTVCIHEQNPNVMKMTIQNLDKNMSSQFELSLLDIDVVELSVPDTDFDSVLTLPSIDFQRMCRDLAILSETIEIMSSTTQLVLRATGDFAKQTITVGEKDSGLVFANRRQDCESTYGCYSLRYLNLFSRANVLCATVQLYLKKDYPLILCYQAASLGRLLFALSHKQPECM
jgi:proliferating cell nuclear antigen